MITLRSASPAVVGEAGAPWPGGIRMRSACLEPATDLVMDLAFLKDQFLRTVNGAVEDPGIEAYLRAATALGEEWTRRAVRPQTWRMYLSGFPAGPIVCVRPPLLAVEAITYTDAGGASATLEPSAYVTLEAGRYGRAQLLAGPAGWPAVGGGAWPVAVDLRCGYADDTAPEFLMLKIGIGLLTGELYKQRTLSVQDPNNTEATITLKYWLRPVY